MSERRYIYRLVVDKWPTANGLPFSDQPQEFWEAIAECAARPNHEGHTECQCPEWLPGDTELAPYLVKPHGVDYPAYLDPPGHTRRIFDPGEPRERDYPGSPGYDIIAVPYATPRRRFQRAGLIAACHQLRAWGCTAHVERAAVSEWEPVNG